MTRLAVDATGAPIQAVALVTAEVVSFTGVSAQSAASPVGADLVRLCPTEDCFVDFGANPTATNLKHFLFGGSEVYFRVVPTQKIAVIQAAAPGNLYISYAV